MATVRASTPSETLGPPAAERPIPLSVPELRGKEWAYLKECLDTGWISSVGPFVSRFERKFVDDYVGGAAYTVAVVNGTAGLHLALRAIFVEPDDEVIVPALTFIAPVNAVRYCGAHPVFIDADPQTWQIDVNQVERFLAKECEVRPDVEGPGAGVSTQTCWNKRTGRRVRAILPVHLLGLACDMERINALATAYHLKVIEDAAEAIGVRYHNRPAGTWGDIGVFSFNGNKTLTCGGGGMLVTRTPAWANRIRYLSTQARDDQREYVHREVGYNYRLTNLHAAIGLAQLEQLDTFLQRKRDIARRYREAFAGTPEITPMPQQDGAAYWLFTVLVSNRAQRDALLDGLAQEGIEARPLWQPIHMQPPYQGCQLAGSMTVATELYERAVSLPSSVGLTDQELERCVRAVRQIVATHHVLH
ncbi:MAG: LegC family aminotransferase [Candidatus Omnitrophota bacterium]|nr:LegC family aminotransferase [Candidatus Omnitrophota bacterium]